MTLPKLSAKNIYVIFMLLVMVALLSYRASFHAVLGAVGVLSVIFGFFQLSGRFFGAFNATFIVTVVLIILNEFKRFFWKDRLQFSDFEVFLDPNNFETVFHYPAAAILAFIFALILAAGFVWGFIRQQKVVSWKVRGIIFINTLILGSACAYYAMLFGQAAWLKTLPKGNNVISNVLFSSHIQFENPGDKLDLAGAEPFEVDAVKPVAKSAEKPDVVLLLQESTVNPQLFGDIAQNSLPAMEMFDSRFADAKGLLRVYTYGGATWKSEFAALTGLASSDFKPLDGAVFYQAVFHVQDSLFKRAKAAGYKVVVITPFTEGAYNSGKAYRALGADEIIHLTELGYPGEGRRNIWTVKSAELMPMIRKYLEAQTQPTFVYSLTMNEHGPYPAEDEKGMALKAADKVKVSQDALLSYENYIARLVEASNAITDFEAWVDQREKATIFMRFGDHQPSIKKHAPYRTDVSSGEYLTFFSLQNNKKDAIAETHKVTDIVFLGGMLLEEMNLPLTPFYAANVTMRQKADGLYMDAEDKTLLKSYQNHIFNSIKNVK